jgi:probable phosphoglycerate mutase
MQTSLYLVRHGTTKFNYHGDPKQDRVKGMMDTPLDERGKVVAQQAADVLAKAGITHIVTSDLSRSKETADIIAAKTGAQVAVSPRLRPWDVGMLAGKPYYSVAHYLKYYQTNPDETPPKGESYNTFMQRYRRAMPELLDFARQSDGKVAAIVHSRHLLALDAVMKGDDSSSVKKVYGAAAPGSILRLDVRASAVKPRHSK